MKKQAFVPGPDQLEGRVVLSSGARFIHGTPVLTSHALSETYAQVEKAFTTYSNHGQNFKKLESNLASAVSRIPWNKRDGLLAAVESEASQMRVDISGGVGTPVKAAMQRALQDVNDFVQGESSGGVMLVR
jgi:hypothetical protein